MADVKHGVVEMLRRKLEHHGKTVTLSVHDARDILAALERGREVEEAMDAILVQTRYKAGHGLCGYYVEDLEIGITGQAVAIEDHAADALLSWAREQKARKA